MEELSEEGWTSVRSITLGVTYFYSHESKKGKFYHVSSKMYKSKVPFYAQLWCRLKMTFIKTIHP
jgi:hypothetical protein